MTISGVEGLSVGELNFELERGGKFVVYKYCISVILMTFQRNSRIVFIKSGESTVARGLGYTAISFLLGWWGIPWGPIYTIGSIISNCKGGTDVTDDVIG